MRLHEPVSPVGLLAMLLAFAGAANAGDSRAILKSAFKDHFLIGAALNQRQFTEQDTNEAALVKLQFNSISPENVMKWDAIHPRPGPDGSNFEVANRYIDFGEKNGMFIVGHTLVWRSQTPHWVFASTNPPPGVTNASPTPSANSSLGTS